MPHNLGFAAGCNAGIELAADADVIALINPDVAVREDFFERLAKLQWPDELGARGPLVLSCSGDVEQSARGFPGARTALFGRTSLLSRIFSGSQAARRELRADPSAGAVKVDWVSGATLIAPRSRFETVGPLDAGYFMYWEDADWCRRAHDAGMRIEYEPTLVVEHLQGSSSRSHRLATTVAFHRSAFRYWRMHVARNPVSLGAAAVALTLRCALKLSALAASSVLDRRRGTSATPARRRS
jgi:GT2 family glycosyltransferase